MPRFKTSNDPLDAGHRGHATYAPGPNGPTPNGPVVDVQPHVSGDGKRLDASPVHKGMTDQQKYTAGVGGLGHSVSLQGGGHIVQDSNAVLDSAYADKPRPLSPPVPTTFGHRSRNDDTEFGGENHQLTRADVDHATVGKAVIAQAITGARSKGQ